MVAAAALLAEAPEQRGDVLPQHAAAVLYEEANQLTHLRAEEQHRVRARTLLFLCSCRPFILTVIQLGGGVILFTQSFIC